MSRFSLIHALLFVAVVAVAVRALPFVKQDERCFSGSQCAESQCCLLGFARYALPRCQPRGLHGDWCFERSEPQNRSLAFPNGEVIDFEDTYHLFCPCAEGLVCRDNVCAKGAFELDKGLDMKDNAL